MTGEKVRSRTALSFYCDDNGTYQTVTKAFRDFFDYRAKNTGVA